jgi:hypothetical protein
MGVCLLVGYMIGCALKSKRIRITERTKGIDREKAKEFFRKSDELFKKTDELFREADKLFDDAAELFEEDHKK